MNSLSIDLSQAQNARPLPGRVLLEIEAKPGKIGALHIPESARDKKMEDTAQFARVVSVGYGSFSERVDGKLKRFGGLTPEDVAPGDRVVFRALASELNQRYVLTDSRRIDCVIE